MKEVIIKIFVNIVMVFAMTMFFSCEGNIKKIQKLDTTEKYPEGIAEDFVLTYTDSAKLKAVLHSKLNLNFSNEKFPYQEFPEGVTVTFYDDEKNESVVTADYGIIYSQTDLIDLRGNVVVETHDGRRLEAPQLYWDQKNQWIFTDKSFIFTSPSIDLKGSRIDFDRDFKTLTADQTKDGVFPIDD